MEKLSDSSGIVDVIGAVNDLIDEHDEELRERLVVRPDEFSFDEIVQLLERGDTKRVEQNYKNYNVTAYRIGGNVIRIDLKKKQ